MAPAVSSERLQMRVLGRALSAGASPVAQTDALKRLLQRQGFYHDGGPPRLAFSTLHLRPVLDYDPNLNGGVWNDVLDLGWIVLQADPDQVARGGLAFGADLGAELRLAYGQGRFVQLAGQIGAAYAPEPDLTTARAQIVLCSRNHLTGWTFLDLCLTEGRAQRSLGTARGQEARVTLSQIFGAQGGQHEVSLGYGLRSQGLPHQQVAELAVESVWPQAVTHLSLTLGEDLPGQAVERVRLEAGLGWIAAGRLSAVGLWAGQSNESRFLGLDRRDSEVGGYVSRTLQNGLNARLEASRTNSSVSFFSLTQISFALSKSF